MNQCSVHPKGNQCCGADIAKPYGLRKNMKTLTSSTKHQTITSLASPIIQNLSKTKHCMKKQSKPKEIQHSQSETFQNLRKTKY